MGPIYFVCWVECKHQMLTHDGRRTTDDDGQPLTTIAHHELFVLRWAKNSTKRIQCLFLNFWSTWSNYFYSSYLMSKKINIFMWSSIKNKYGNCYWTQVNALGWHCGDVDNCVLNFHRKTNSIPAANHWLLLTRFGIIHSKRSNVVVYNSLSMWLTSLYCLSRKKLLSNWNCKQL